MRDQKARTVNAKMARALADLNCTPELQGGMPEHVDCIKGTPRPWYDRIKPLQTMATKSRTSKTEPRIGEAHLTNRYRKGYSGGVGRKQK